jgi:dihydrolipoamide dehydrogenase
VGLTEKQAIDAGYEIKIGVEQFADYGRAQAIGETEGVVKIVVDARTNEILGGHILGPHADILIHQVAIAMHDHGKLERLTKTIHVHPTLSEVVKGAAKAAR